MRTVTRIAVVALVTIGVVAGCDMQNSQINGPPVTRNAQPAGGDAYLNQTAVREETADQSNTAVDAALAWAKKYTQATEQCDRLREENRALRDSNQEYQQQLSKLQLELNRAEKELSEANAMLLEMREELRKWKTSVIGFRDEMRQAQQAQLDAMYKILKLLGGEPVVQVSTRPSTTQPARNGQEN